MSSYYLSHPPAVNETPLNEEIRRAPRASIDELLRIVPSIQALLTPEQRRLLPPRIASYLDARTLAAIAAGRTERSRRRSPIRWWLPRRSSRRRSARQMTLRFVFAAALLTASGLGRVRPLAAQTDVIRGRVTSASGGDKPIEGASVTATTLSGGVNRSARTDRNGRYTITFPGGEGDYFVTVIAIGYVPRRFEVKRMADQDILIGDMRLTLCSSTLDTIVTVGRRDRALRGDTIADIGGMDRIVNATNVAVEQ